MLITKLNDEQRKLVEANVDLVPFAISRYLKSIVMDYDDMISVGYYGLCRAAQCYNKNLKMKFSTYAIKAIVRTIKRESQFALRKKRGSEFVTVSLDVPIVIGDIETDSYDCFIQDNSIDIENTVINKVLCEKIWDMVPIYAEIEKGISEKEICERDDVKKTTLNMRKRKELMKAKSYLASQDIWQAV